MSGEHEPTANEEMPVHIDDEKGESESLLDQLEQKILAFVGQENLYSTKLGDMLKHMTTSSTYPPALVDVSPYRIDPEERDGVEYILEFDEQDNGNWVATQAASHTRLSPVSKHGYDPAIDLWLVSVVDNNHKIEYGWCLRGTKQSTGTTMQSPRIFQFPEHALTLPSDVHAQLPQNTQIYAVFMVRNPMYLNEKLLPAGETAPWLSPFSTGTAHGDPHFSDDFSAKEDAQNKYTSMKQYTQHYDTTDNSLNCIVTVQFNAIPTEDEQAANDASNESGGA